VEDEDNRSALRSSPEIARRFRRTVYTHDDWKKHRQQDRFTIYLGSMFKSGVFENSKNEVMMTTAFAAFVCLYNALVGGYTDLVGVAHPPPLPGQVVGLPVNAFSLTGSSLGLLLSKYSYQNGTFHQMYCHLRRLLNPYSYHSFLPVNYTISLSCQCVLQAVGRSTKELGIQYCKLMV
jgi:hypothetical protein